MGHPNQWDINAPLGSSDCLPTSFFINESGHPIIPGDLRLIKAEPLQAPNYFAKRTDNCSGEVLKCIMPLPNNLPDIGNSCSDNQSIIRMHRSPPTPSQCMQMVLSRSMLTTGPSGIGTGRSHCRGKLFFSQHGNERFFYSPLHWLGCYLCFIYSVRSRQTTADS